MIPTIDFIDNFLFDTFLGPHLKEYKFSESDLLEVFNGHVSELFKAINKHSVCLPQLIVHMQSKRYTEAKKSLGYGDDYCYYSTDVYHHRRKIKSLLSGLISVAAIQNLTDLDYCQQIYKSEANSILRSDEDHLLLKFCKITTIEENKSFVDYFENYLIEMIFQFLDIFIQRLTSALKSLLDQDQFIDQCNDALIVFDTLKAQIEKLKLSAAE